jgi:plastocyanin
MRKLIPLVLVLAAAAVLAGSALAATKSVKVGDNYYVRSRGVPTVTVSKGTKVKWRFVTDTGHTVTVKSGPTKFNSGVRTGGSYSKTLRKRGTYTIYCTIHGLSDQRMKLVVK